jgi:hypothetical protein
MVMSKKVRGVNGIEGVLRSAVRGGVGCWMWVTGCDTRFVFQSPLVLVRRLGVAIATTKIEKMAKINMNAQ